MFEKIVNIVSKVVQILSYAMDVFFGTDVSDRDGSSSQKGSPEP